MTMTDKANILVVDDLPEKLLVIGRSSRSWARTSSRPAPARRRCARAGHEFAVILLDVNMPGMDGFETAALIRAAAESAHTPIIFITAFADEMHTAAGLLAGRGRLHPLAGGARRSCGPRSACSSTCSG